SETWAGENMYCPACLNNSLDKTKTNKAVLDFTCPNCNEGYQLKSKKSPFGKKVSNSAYQPKIDAIHSGTIPNFTFLQYDSDEWLVKELFIVPSHFMTESIVEKRKPLPQGAKRSGWVGSNILLGNLARDAKIPIVDDGEPLPKETVKKRWKQFEFMQNQTAESRGWLSDILMCVRRINQENFTLKQIYEFEDKLSKLHPKNKHIRAKIRQQLQVLRDKNIIEFIGDGWYQVKSQKKLREG
ncbi:MAG: restriction endonuclease, partial [Hadesarchaea archaeon]|nr:restriction endonuclease [Hadesarchaea archaeon]